MRKTVSFKLFFTVLWRGVCQMAKFVGKLLGFRGKTPFAKTVWRIFVACGATLSVIFTSMILYMFVTEFVFKELLPGLRHDDMECVARERHLSNYIVWQALYGKNSRLYDQSKGTVLLDGVDWVAVSADKDSLAVFAKDGKRGYLNRFTGEVVIQPVYSKAWVFSEGIAAVEEGGRLKFIDHKGNVVIDNGFEVNYIEPQYVFHNGLCVMQDNVTGLFGCIDTNGKWALEPEFDYVSQIGKFMLVYKKQFEGLYRIVASDKPSIVKLHELFPTDYRSIEVDEYEGTILARAKDYTAKIYDFDMNVIQNFVIEDVIELKYDTHTVRTFLDENGDEVCETVYAVANSRIYKVGESFEKGRYGLMSQKGHRITPPVYEEIVAIGQDRYLCHPQGVILNDNGVVL